MAFAPPSLLVQAGIPGLSFLVAAALVALSALAAPRASRARTAAIGVLVAAGYFGWSGALAGSGLLATAMKPPPALLLMLPLTVATVSLARSRVGERMARNLPLAALVGIQAFRLPLELVLHRAAQDGTMPIQMSFQGYNFDIVSGSTALVLSLLLSRGRVSRGLVLAWNVLGTVLLAVIVSIAVASLPFIAAFGPDRVNEWVLHVPYVWLPAILVEAALFGHLLVYRRLATSPESEGGANGAKASAPS